MPNCLVFAMQALFTIILGWSSCLSSVPVPFQTILPATSTSAPHECAPPIVLALSLDVPIRSPSLIDAAITRRRRFKPPAQRPAIQWTREQCLQQHASTASLPCLRHAGFVHDHPRMVVLLIECSCAVPNDSTSHKHICAARVRATHRVGTFAGCSHGPRASSTQPSPGDEDLSHLPSDLQFSGHGSSAYNSMPNCLVFAMQALFTIILGWSSCLSSVPVPFQTILPATSTSAPHECAPPIVLALSLDVPIRPPASSTQPSPRRRRFKPPAQRPAIQWTREQCLQQHA
ncbi:hypothetical protein MTO96_038276 [Rhipicephalus appendiculatus]